jgi:hypothetical protein
MQKYTLQFCYEIILSNVIENLNRGAKGNQGLKTSDYFSLDNVPTHVQLNQFDN